MLHISAKTDIIRDKRMYGFEIADSIGKSYSYKSLSSIDYNSIFYPIVSVDTIERETEMSMDKIWDILERSRGDIPILEKILSQLKDKDIIDFNGTDIQISIPDKEEYKTKYRDEDNSSGSPYSSNVIAEYTTDDIRSCLLDEILGVTEEKVELIVEDENFIDAVIERLDDLSTSLFDAVKDVLDETYGEEGEEEESIYV